jgi:hypothetical protein
VSDRTESREGLRRNGRRLHLPAWCRLSRVDEEDEDGRHCDEASGDREDR